MIFKTQHAVNVTADKMHAELASSRETKTFSLTILIRWVQIWPLNVESLRFQPIKSS